MKKIQLSQGYEVSVDDEDYEELNKYKWHIGKRKGFNYAYRKYHDKEIYKKTKNKSKATISIAMHRQIMKTTKGFDVDHLDHNTSNNQKENLRNVTRSQNNTNRNKRIGTSSKYKGVCWNKGNKKWVAIIWNKHLGCFDTEEEAALAYNKVAAELYEHAKLNILKENNE
jgi:hypothetical protein